jgi:hypothetical protein
MLLMYLPKVRAELNSVGENNGLVKEWLKDDYFIAFLDESHEST